MPNKRELKEETDVHVIFFLFSFLKTESLFSSLLFTVNSNTAVTGIERTGRSVLGMVRT
jgi:hypothetical protein